MSRPNGSQVTIGVMVALVLVMAGLIGAEAWNRAHGKAAAGPAVVAPAQPASTPAQPAQTTTQPEPSYQGGGDG